MKSKFFTKRNIVLIIVLFVFISSISIFFNITGRRMSDEFRVDWNYIYAEVIERNTVMLENVVEYGDEFCSGYISVKNDKAVHTKVLDELQLLSDEICNDAESDYEKVSRIAYWVAENIYYNHISATTAVTSETISLERVLETKTATCAGYSNLFSALCNMQGIYCVNLRGGTYSKNVETADYLINAPLNHEWNAVLIDNEWIFVDTTWMSNNAYIESGYEKSDDFDNQYFDMTLEEMSYEHRIDIIDYRNFKSSINVFDE